MRLEKFKWLSEYQIKQAKKIIEKHYNYLMPIDTKIALKEIQNLVRKEKLGTLDDNQELLIVKLERELLR